VTEGSVNGNPTVEKTPRGRALAAFTVELDVYSGPYEGLLALILKDEVEIFEVPLRELVALYRDTNPPTPPGETPGTLERDTDFVDSATSLVLLKGCALAPTHEPEGEEADEAISPQDLEERLVNYLKVRRGAEALAERFARSADLYPSAHALRPRPGRLKLSKDRLAKAARRVLSRTAEPKVSHLGPITVTIQELAALIRISLVRGPLSFEDLVHDMDRLRSAVAFSAALSLAAEGSLTLSQPEPFGPLTLAPRKP
jgi:segregation and condensation protein A